MTTEFQRKAEQHAAEVGRVAIAWNALCETMAIAFSLILKPDHQGAALSVWHSVKSDRYQREMLRAAAIAMLGDKNQAALKEIEWVLGQIDATENRRNDAIHAPYAIQIENGLAKPMPSPMTGNPKAENLKDRDLVEALQAYSTRMSSLDHFLHGVMVHLVHPDNPLPKRPTSANPYPRPERSEAQMGS